jgi:hypothetical protein
VFMKACWSMHEAVVMSGWSTQASRTTPQRVQVFTLTGLPVTEPLLIREHRIDLGRPLCLPNSRRDVAREMRRIIGFRDTRCESAGLSRFPALSERQIIVMERTVQECWQRGVRQASSVVAKCAPVSAVSKRMLRFECSTACCSHFSPSLSITNYSDTISLLLSRNIMSEGSFRPWESGGGLPKSQPQNSQAFVLTSAVTQHCVQPQTPTLRTGKRHRV